MWAAAPLLPPSRSLVPPPPSDKKDVVAEAESVLDYLEMVLANLVWLLPLFQYADMQLFMLVDNCAGVFTAMGLRFGATPESGYSL